MKKKIKIILLCIISIGIIISSYNILKWYINSNSTKKEIENIKNILNNDILTISNPYTDFIKLDSIKIDFLKLKEINNDTKGWLKVNNTNINYPIVQGLDNKYYLTHSFNKSYNKFGWVFIDYRNDINLLNKNNIIYAHGLMNKTMFGTLKNVNKEDWLNNKNNHIINLNLENKNTLWKVFSIYTIKNTADYLIIDFDSDNDFISFSNMLIKRSIYKFNEKITKSDKILTLSTCYTKNIKIVLHAKLVQEYFI